MNLSFYQKEESCQNAFDRMGPVFHCVSREDFEVIFIEEREYCDAMMILAVCCRLFPGVIIYSFQIMSNHFHFIVGGKYEEIESFIALFVKRLGKYMDKTGRRVDLNNIIFNYFEINDLEYFRSSIAYCNRNGFVVNDSVAPFSYPWGANICYFNPTLKRYYERCREISTLRQRRDTIHGKVADKLNDIYLLDGCVSPFCFCKTEEGELAFRDAQQYFIYVSRKVESYKMIASSIGESIAYTDADLFSVVKKLSTEKYGMKNPSLLTSKSKMEISKVLHFDYNAGNKQIARILKINVRILNSMF